MSESKLSDHEISVLTLILTLVAAITGLIAAIPQVPVILSMFTRSKARVELQMADDVYFSVNLRNLKRKRLENIVVMLEISGVNRVVPTNGRKLVQGVALGSAFSNLTLNMVQAKLKGPIAPRTIIGLGGLEVDWGKEKSRFVQWFVYVDGNVISKGVQEL